MSRAAKNYPGSAQDRSRIAVWPIGGCGAVPAAAGPAEVLEAVVAADVHVAEQVDHSVRSVDQTGQEVGGEGVDRQHPGMPFWAGVAVTVAVDAGVVDDGVHPAELVDLVGEGPGLPGAGEIPDNACCTAVDQVGERGRSFAVAGVEDHLVPVVEQGGGQRCRRGLGRSR